jgi:hypothetical protein
MLKPYPLGFSFTSSFILSLSVRISYDSLFLKKEQNISYGLAIIYLVKKTKTKQNYFNFLDYFNIFITIISIYL